jgi:hypothetical protein
MERSWSCRMGPPVSSEDWTMSGECVLSLRKKPKDYHRRNSEKYVDIVGSFQTGYNISGIAPFGDLLVVLAYIPDEDDREKKFSTTVPSRQVIISVLHSHCTL